MKPVIIESPYAGDVEANTQYAQAAMLDSLTNHNEAPFLSHLLYPQVLDDGVSKERLLGIRAGFAWGKLAKGRAFYIDNGMSGGMIKGLEEAIKARQPIIFRSLHGRTAPIEITMPDGVQRIEMGEWWTPYDPCEALQALLQTVDHVVDIRAIRKWTKPQRDAASRWATSVKANEFDSDVVIPDKPDHLQGYNQLDLMGGPDTVTISKPVRKRRVQLSPKDDLVHYPAMGGVETLCLKRIKHQRITMDSKALTCSGCKSKLGIT